MGKELLIKYKNHCDKIEKLQEEIFDLENKIAKIKREIGKEENHTEHLHQLDILKEKQSQAEKSLKFEHKDGYNEALIAFFDSIPSLNDEAKITIEGSNWTFRLDRETSEVSIIQSA